MGEMNAACNVEQAITRTAEQSHLTALAERDALAAQVEALTAQRDEAVRLLRLGRPDVGQWTAEWYDARNVLLRGVDQ